MSKKHPELVGGLLILLLILAETFSMHYGIQYFGSLPHSGDLQILMYHCITEDPEMAKTSGLYVTTEKFEEDLKYLAENGYHTVLPAELLSKEKLPPKPVMISFDDGYLDNYTLAFPLLEKYGMKAEISVIVSFIDDPQRTLFMDWDQLREMQASGLVEIGSHTFNRHGSKADDSTITDENVYGIKRLPGETPEEYEVRIMDDVLLSKAMLEENLGTPVNVFTYPYGYSSRFERRYIEKYFPVSFSTKEGTVGSNDRYNNLPRLHSSQKIPMSEILY